MYVCMYDTEIISRGRCKQLITMQAGAVSTVNAYATYMGYTLVSHTELTAACRLNAV